MSEAIGDPWVEIVAMSCPRHGEFNFAARTFGVWLIKARDATEWVKRCGFCGSEAESRTGPLLPIDGLPYIKVDLGDGIRVTDIDDRSSLLAFFTFDMEYSGA